MDKLYDENIKRKLRQEQQEHERRERQALIEEQERKRKEKEQAAMQYRILNQEIKSTKEDNYDLTDKYWYRKMFRKYPNRFLSLYTTYSEGTGFVYIANNGLPYKLVIKDTVLTVDDLYVPDSIAMICYGDGSDRRGNTRLRGWKRAGYEYLSAEEWDLKLFEFCELTIEGMNSLDESYMSTEEKDSYYKLGKKSNVNLFDNQDTSDFSDFSQIGSGFQMSRRKGFDKVDPFANKDTSSDKAFEELSKQFQFF